MGRKAEVNLEIGSGFFRIIAEDAIYNITVLEGQGAVVRKENRSPPAPSSQASDSPSGEGYYKQVSTDLYRDIGQLAKQLSSTIMDIPMEDRKLKRVELDQAGEKIEDAKSQLKDIVEMTESATMEIMDCVEDIQGQTRNVQELLSILKDHKAFLAPEGGGEEEGGGQGEVASVETIREQLHQAREIVAQLQEGVPVVPVGESPPDTTPRYLFAFDTIFQTLYEFCTNETVKGHLSKVREQGEKLFDHEALLDGLNTLAAPLEPDEDNFLQFQLADLLKVLAHACSDDKFKNLFKRMITNRETIFLDQNLPLEVPPREEQDQQEPEGGEQIIACDPQLEELAGILANSMEDLDRLPAGDGAAAPGMSTMSMADQTEIFNKIETAFGIVNNISSDVQKITETLSFQDLSGQQIMKIIKLLSDFQVQLLAIVVSFGSQLKHKEQNAGITVEEGKRLAQEDVDAYINRVGGPEEEGEPGGLDQEAVNRMLEDMGF